MIRMQSFAVAESPPPNVISVCFVKADTDYDHTKKAAVVDGNLESSERVKITTEIA